MVVQTKQRERDLSPVEAARVLGVGLEHVYKLLWAGKLAGRKQGKLWRVSQQAVEERRNRLKLIQGGSDGKTQK